MNFKNKILLVGLLLFVCSHFVCAEDTYVEAMQKLREEQQEAKKEIIAAVVSFNQAFKDAFRLIDDEFSRLIYAMVGLTGVVFAIMFLVYAKTTSRYKRDIQILMKAHSKHIDNLVSARLDEFMEKMDSRLMEETKTALSKVESDFDIVMQDIVPPEPEPEPEIESVSEPEPKSESKKEEKSKKKKVKVKKEDQVERLKKIKEKFTKVEEALVDKDGKVPVLKEPTPPLNRFKKRVRSGFRKLFGKNKEVKDVKEFKE
jgi:hypothetical protein